MSKAVEPCSQQYSCRKFLFYLEHL